MNESNSNNMNTQWELGAENQNSENTSWQQRYPNPYADGSYYGQNADYSSQFYRQQPPYPNSQYYGQPYPVPVPVTNVFFYILMALTAISAFMTVSFTASLIRALVDGAFLSPSTPDAISGSYAAMYNYLVNVMANSSAYSFYSVLNSALSFAILAISIVDIVLVHKKGYPCLGLILFAIFFKPGYFIWRAHVVHQKKLIPVMFTVCYVLLYILYFLWCVLFVMSVYIP